MLFEQSETKSVRIVPEVEGQPTPGFAVDTITVDPPAVVVIGPGSALKDLSQAITESISVNGARAAVTESVTVGVTDPSVRLREPLVARVTVNIVPVR
jgi:YbbR domain-containing protein